MPTEGATQPLIIRPRGQDQLRSSTERSQSPVSISEAARLASASSNGKKRRISPARNTEFDRREFIRQSNGPSRLQVCQTSTPLTPSLDAGPGGAGINDFRYGNISRRHRSQSNANTPEARGSDLARSERREDVCFEPTDEYSVESTPGTVCSSRLKVQVHREESAGANERNTSSSTTGLGLTTPFARPRPAALDTAAAQDMSLPSPSLSPVTAAANLQNRRSYFEDSTLQRRNGLLALSSPPHEGTDEEDSADLDTSMSRSWPDEMDMPNDYLDPVMETSDQLVSPSTMMDIPKMLDSFEAMPPQMKTYVMYQLLRRCPKPVLHFVAGTVNPALKCDFLNLLPSELCQNIVGHLDVRSLCRAAQVSRKWRQVIDADEKTWKRLFDARGFVLPPGELQRAIREGWGWQHGSGNEDWEKDLSEQDATVNFEGWDSSSTKGDPTLIPAPSPDQQLQGAQMKRSKRKAPSKPRIGSRKQQKKRDVGSAALAQYDYDALMKLVSSADGPYGAARAAAIAVPYSKIGLPSLRHLHLYKSIYRRHHLISSYWMQDKIEPKHLAFKAHQRHVVTCLQFDSDKILTGSDDTNINVYDTQTGALRARLEGHEGGVWALQYQGNVLVSGSTDRSVRVWDIKRGVCTHVFQGHTSTVRCLVILMPTTIGIAPDGRPIIMPREPLIITGSRDSNLRVWRLPEDGDPPFMQAGPSQDETDCPYFVRALTGHHHSVRAIAAHGDTLVSGSYDCTVRVWKISTGETVHRLQGHTQKVYSVVLDHERNRCISGSMDNLVKVWSLETGFVLYNLEGHSSLVGLLDLQQDCLVSAAADSTLRVWEPETGFCKSVLKAHTGAITCFQHDGQKVISGSDRTLKMWNVQDGKFVRDLLTDLSGVWQVKFDGRRCVAAVQRNNLTYIEVSTNPAIRQTLSLLNLGT